MPSSNYRSWLVMAHHHDHVIPFTTCTYFVMAFNYLYVQCLALNAISTYNFSLKNKEGRVTICPHLTYSNSRHSCTSDYLPNQARPSTNRSCKNSDAPSRIHYHRNLQPSSNNQILNLSFHNDRFIILILKKKLLKDSQYVPLSTTPCKDCPIFQMYLNSSPASCRMSSYLSISPCPCTNIGNKVYFMRRSRFYFHFATHHR